MSVIDRAKKYVESHEKRSERGEREDRKPNKAKKDLKNQFEAQKKELSPERVELLERIAKDFNKNVALALRRNTKSTKCLLDTTGMRPSQETSSESCLSGVKPPVLRTGEKTRHRRKRKRFLERRVMKPYSRYRSAF